MTGFEIDPTMFPKIAAQLDEQRTTLASYTDVVKSYASGNGNPWGGDEQGSAFGAIYADVLNHVTDVMTSHGDLLSYASTELKSWAEEVVVTDDQVASQLHDLGGGGA